MDDMALNSSFYRELGAALEGMDSTTSDERKQGEMKQGGDEGKERELEDHVSNGRRSSASGLLSALKWTLQMMKLHRADLLERGSGKRPKCLHVLTRKTR